ncbi:acyltransferase [Achromobacter xylosoxidans]|uniref:Acyltransferase 3 domain-containing protein n=4 Tax=Achromobacter TaxID=222 RepID=A0A6S7D0N4_9BURK|nr:acyltransferase [Achromobacter ruhlandii]AKP92102.1 putative acyltransferase [Achromobacter xylosoxidans]ALX86146.1 acyltransferase [Achromobacter denitrificans]MCZ8397293.1 acyltransferase [Achromobacter ruhlandii]MCZ8431266.1 acyltransferase [Achromobacter ruhlandii]MDC6149855.1 acyltransferase [Achromobacter ruhlandii]
MGMLRTLLALSVVLDHLGGGTTDWLVGGRLAVQLFYVISGFLISYVLTATDHYRGAPGRFYANRALRLYPVYLAVAALTLLAYAGNGGAAFWRVYEGLPLAATLFLALSNLVILGQDWLMFFGIEHGALAFTGSFAHSDVPLYQGLLVPQAWTLGVELSFYLIAPFVLHSPRRLLALLVASLALRVALVASGIGVSDPWTYRFFPTELALFLAGSLSHQVLLPRWQAWMARAPRLPEVGTGLLLLYVLAHFSIGLPHTVRDGLAVLLFAALLPLAFLFQSRHRLDKVIGELSYPIYICHALVILFFDWLLDGTQVRQPAMFTALVVAGCIGFAALLNTLIADPVERLRRRLRRAPPANVTPEEPAPVAGATRAGAPRPQARAAGAAAGTMPRAPSTIRRAP